MSAATVANRSPVQLLEAITVGLPFCAFKILTGSVLTQRPWVGPFGWALIALGGVDALINVGNLASLVVGRERVRGVCLTAIVARRWKPPVGLRVWSIAVVLNVLGAGIGRLSSSVGSLRSPHLEGAGTP